MIQRRARAQPLAPILVQSAAPRGLEYAAVLPGDLGEWFKPAVLKTADG